MDPLVKKTRISELVKLMDPPGHHPDPEWFKKEFTEGIIEPAKSFTHETPNSEHATHRIVVKHSEPRDAQERLAFDQRRSCIRGWMDLCIDAHKGGWDFDAYCALLNFNGNQVWLYPESYGQDDVTTTDTEIVFVAIPRED